jgi:1,4-dihydroxy-2-naphthoyl-CoA hydrolase
MSDGVVDGPAIESYKPELAAMMLRDGGGGGITEYLGLRLVDVGPGTATAEIEVTPELVHNFGAVHGGVVATLVDHVLGAAVLPVVPAGTWPATLEFKLNYLAPVREGVIRAESQILSLRRRTAVVQVTVTNPIADATHPVATALGTIALTPPKSA